MNEKINLSDAEIENLLDHIIKVYGYDFTGYARASLYRRINRLFSLDKFTSFSDFAGRIIADRWYMLRFIEEITVNMTEMFRDPGFFSSLRKKIIPELAGRSLIRIWLAGCSSGEEVFSLAILLQELHLLDRSIIYATDLNPAVLKLAKRGVFPMQHMKQYSQNYINSGGNMEFSSYYSARHDYATFNPGLVSRVVFSTHNLVTDHSFNLFQLIICRNVLIYFNRNLQNRVFSLFHESLDDQGFLGLGPKETVRFSQISGKFRQVSEEDKIWKKIA